MRRLVVAPLIGLALLISAAPASADPEDWGSLRHDALRHHQVVRYTLDLVRVCRMPSQAESLELATAANEISRRAGGIAWQLSGLEHRMALDIQRTAETDFWSMVTLSPPEQCYAPPAE